MSKMHLASIIFLAVMVIALIPLTLEIFGKMNTDIIMISAGFALVGLIGNGICSFIRAVDEWKNK